MYNCICITPFLYAYVYLHEYIYRYVCVYVYVFVEGSLEVKLSTIWTDEKPRWEESERREE